mgnify:FL=1
MLFRSDWSIPTGVLGQYNRIYCLSRNRWNNIKTRTQDKQSVLKTSPTYLGCKNLFKDFNEFVEWSRDEVGYNFCDKIGGKDVLWAIDKDILKIGNINYSPDTCLLVPCRVNSFMTGRSNDRGDFPIGLNWHKPLNKFRAQINYLGIRKHLGYFDDIESAHRAWQLAKIRCGRELALDFKINSVIPHPKLYNGLQKIISTLEDDYSNKRLTTIFN